MKIIAPVITGDDRCDNPSIAISTIIRRLHAPVQKFMSKHEAKALGIDPKTLSRSTLLDHQFVLRTIRMANFVKYETLRNATTFQLGLNTSIPWNEILRQDDVFAKLMRLFHESPVLLVECRRDIGLVLHTIRENAQMHMCHQKAYRWAIRDVDFIYQAHMCERIRSQREKNWITLVHADDVLKKKSQLTFARQMLQLTQGSIDVPKVEAPDAEWTKYMHTVSTICGNDVLAKIGLNVSDKHAIRDSFFRAACETRVGDVLPSILRVYFQVGNLLPSDLSNVANGLASTYGWSCFFDVFFMAHSRYSSDSTDQMFDLFAKDFLSDVKVAFHDAVLAEHTQRCDEDSNPHRATARANERQDALIAQVEDERSRSEHKREIRRSKKKKKRRNNKTREPISRQWLVAEEDAKSDGSSTAGAALEDVRASTDDTESTDQWSTKASVGDDDDDLTSLKSWSSEEEVDEFATQLCATIEDLFEGCPECEVLLQGPRS